jgi:hypothetical protein
MAAPSLSAMGSMYLVKFSDEPSERPPEMIIFAEVSSGPVGMGDLGALEASTGPDPRRPDRLDRGGAARARGLEGRGPDRHDLLGVGRLHGLDRVAGIDRPLEGVGREHLRDVGDLHDVEERGHAGITFLPMVVAGATIAS